MNECTPQLVRLIPNLCHLVPISARAGALLRELRAAERDAARDAAELAAADLGGFFGMASVKRKRKKAMNKHKHRKRRRRDRHQNK